MAPEMEPGYLDCVVLPALTYSSTQRQGLYPRLGNPKFS